MAWGRRQSGVGAEDFAPIIAVVTAGIALSVMLFFIARGYFFAADRDQFQRDAAFYGATFRSTMERHVNSLAAIHAFVTASHDVNRWEFSNFAHQILPQNSGFKAVLWLPEVRADGRARFEAELQKDGLFGLTLRELAADGQLVSAGARDDYLPVAYVEPFEDSGSLIGVDLAHNPIYAPLFEAARQTNKVVASPPLERALVEGAKAPLVVLAFPLNRHTTAQAVSTGIVTAGKSKLARAAAPNNLEGFALGVVQLDRVVAGAIGPRAPIQAVIAYGKKDAPIIFGGGMGQTLTGWFGAAEFHQLEPFRVAGQPFFLAIRSAEKGEPLTRTYVPAGVALFALMLTALLTQSMLSTTMRKRQVERAVVARTAELSHSNQALTEEIGQRRAAETALIAARDRAEAANRAKSAFLSTMSHELRTPLNAIIGFSGMMLASADGGGAKASDYLGEINGAGGRLLHLINDILEITQMDTDERASGELVYLPDLVESVMDKLRPDAEAANVALQAAVSEKLPALTGDGKRLKRALEHLVSNAIKFGGAGGFAVIGARLGDGGLVLDVSDNGVGLKSGTEAAAMALFAQGDSSLTRRHDGVGLGLTFVARVAHHHGAAMRIHSKPNEGTRVALIFPQSRIVQAREVA
ncbi:MAG TPA: CHASE domain-containing protein [Rhizomicrobium sp.]|jgi:signal transduction histidine kinase|nr:CHASE domain-containing protein [Rhizomicrobium sp.]